METSHHVLIRFPCFHIHFRFFLNLAYDKSESAECDSEKFARLLFTSDEVIHLSLNAPAAIRKREWVLMGGLLEKHARSWMKYEAVKVKNRSL